MEQIEIHNATVEDAQGIATVHVKTWQSAYKGQLPDFYLDTLSIDKRTEGWKDQLQNLEEGTYALIAKVNNSVIGWCTLGTNRDNDVSSDVGEVHGIYVLPDYAGKGAGSQLLNKAYEILKNAGYTKATLWVLDSNEKSKKWYESKGWQPEGRTQTVKHSGGFEMHEVRYIIDLK